MSFGVNIHHILAKEVLNQFSEKLNGIFGGAENNPFNPDADFNKIALLSDRALAPVVQQLAAGPNGRSVLPESFGLDAHTEGHKPLNDFQSDAIKEIPMDSSGLSPGARQRAVFDVYRHLKDAAVDGH